MRRKRHWHRRYPLWWTEEYRKDWEHGPPFPVWQRHRFARSQWPISGRFLFLRFAAVFGLLALLICGILAALAAVALVLVPLRSFPGATIELHPLQWLLALLGLALLLAIALRRVGSLAARRFTSPLSETMKAADALAAGDLSARVPVEGSDEFRHLAHSFNHMAEALETANRQRNELMADIAHELRTPLTIIQGNLEGLRDGVYEAAPERLDLILDETQKLGRLVDDLRLLTLAEAGQLSLDLQTLDVAQLLADVRDAFAVQASESEITLRVDVAHPVPPIVADPQRLGQVLGNLVTNALRHTPPGGQITLSASTINQDHEVALRVSDTGEGIPAKDLPRIFDRFWRGDPARSRESGAGSGLGLAIAKGLVEAHGGQMWAESQVGQGTTISCIFPLNEGQ
jgi:signal transduction histidine kinase